MSQPLPDHISLTCAVVEVKTTRDGGIRLVLEMGETAVDAAAWLMATKAHEVALEAAFVRILPDIRGATDGDPDQPAANLNDEDIAAMMHDDE